MLDVSWLSHCRFLEQVARIEITPIGVSSGCLSNPRLTYRAYFHHQLILSRPEGVDLGWTFMIKLRPNRILHSPYRNRGSLVLFMSTINNVSPPFTSILLPLSIFLFLTHPKGVSGNIITWSSPSYGDVFGPGEIILGNWTSSLGEMASHTLRLCLANDGSRSNSDGCGSHITPTIQRFAGSYITML